MIERPRSGICKKSTRKCGASEGIMAELSTNCTGLEREKDVRFSSLGRPRPLRQKIVVSNVGRAIHEPERSVIAATFWIAVWLDSRILTIASSGCSVNG